MLILLEDRLKYPWYEKFVLHYQLRYRPENVEGPRRRRKGRTFPGLGDRGQHEEEEGAKSQGGKGKNIIIMLTTTTKARLQPPRTAFLVFRGIVTHQGCQVRWG